MTKTITDARALISSGDQADLKKLKSLQSILRDKLAEIKGLDREIADETKEECIGHVLNEQGTGYEHIFSSYEHSISLELKMGHVI